MSNPTHSGGIANATPTAPMPEPERTPCCNATLTGTDDGPACRNCYEYVPPSEMITDATPTAPRPGLAQEWECPQCLHIYRTDRHEVGACPFCDRTNR